MKTRPIIVMLVLSALLAALPGCQYLKKRVPKTEKVEYKLNSAGKTRIEIDNTNGDIEVAASEDTLSSIVVSAETTYKVKITEQDKPIQGIEVKIDSSGDVIRVDTEYEHFDTFLGNRNDAKVNYKVIVPAGLPVYITLTNGTIKADKLHSNLKLENVNGSILVNSCSGTIDVENVNGSVKANLDSIKTFTAETVNGSISVGNLKEANAVVEADCIHGKVKAENLNFVNMTSGKKSLSGKLGDGSGMIKLSTTNGSIRLDGNYVGMQKRDDHDLDFNIEFDDNDEPVKIKIEKTDEQKGTGIPPKDTSRAKDSVKSK